MGLNQSRVILHLDMDAFYASVEELDNPAIRGKPVIVGGGENRGVVSAASYKAREFGVHSALPMATARRLCPDGIFLPVRMARYQEISSLVFEIFHNFTPLVEPLSLDEAFLDVSDSSSLFGSGEEMACEIKQLVKKTTGLTISAGVASNKLVAKIASDLEKPDGLTIVAPGEEGSFLAPLPIKRLWGVGKTTQKKLKLFGVQTIGDLVRLPATILESEFGKLGGWMLQSAQGIDHRPVEPKRLIKSMGNEETYGTDLRDLTHIHQELLALANKVGSRLRRHGFSGRTVSLKVKYHDFVTKTRSKTLNKPTNDHLEIFKWISELLKKTEAGKKPIRLLGVSLANLDSSPGAFQLDLFHDKQKQIKRDTVNKAVDSIHDRFGHKAILPGTLLKK